MKKIDEVIIDVLGELSGWKTATTTTTVDKTGPGGSRSRGQFAKSYPIGGMIADPDERPELDDGTTPKLERKEEKKGEDLGFGFNDAGYPLQDKYEFQGMPIAIENSAGSVRKWYDENGDETGQTEMHNDYGYIEGVKGVDKDEVDVYVGSNPDAEFVFVVHQTKKPDFEEYDEDKVMLGFELEEHAREAYLKHYDDDRFYGGMSSMPISAFKEKLKDKEPKITNEAAFDGEEERAIYGLGDVMTDPWVVAKVRGRGYDISDHAVLGSGGMGTAFDIGNNRVLKLTTDEDEAKSSNHIRGKNMKNVVRVFDVFKLPKERSGKAGDVYGIVQEKLQEMPNDKEEQFTQAMRDLKSATGVATKYFINGRRWDAFVGDVITKAARRGKEDVARKALAQLEDLEMNDMVDQLNTANVEFEDYHPGNIMMRGTNFVITDLGFSQSPGADPDVLEATAVTRPTNSMAARAAVATAQLDPSFFEKWSDKLLRRGIDTHGARELGHGSNGTAFQLKSGEVLKVTKDKMEAKTSAYIKGKKLRNVVQIYDVFKFPAPNDVYYGILQEKLQDMSSTEVRRFDDLDDLLQDAVEDSDEWRGDNETTSGGYYSILTGLKNMTWDEFEEYIYHYVKTPQAKLKAKRALAMLKDQFQLDKIADQLVGIGIQFHDYHTGNIMRRGNEHVIIDLGVSRSPAPGEIPTLEAVIREQLLSLFEGSISNVDLRRAFKSVSPETRKKAIEFSKRHGGMGSLIGMMRDMAGWIYGKDNIKNEGGAHTTKEDIPYLWKNKGARNELFSMPSKPLFRGMSFDERVGDEGDRKRLKSKGMFSSWSTDPDVAEGYGDEKRYSFLFKLIGGNYDLLFSDKDNTVSWFDELFDIYVENTFIKSRQYERETVLIGKEFDVVIDAIYDNDFARKGMGLTEAKADTVVVVLGRFQPFHRDWSEEIRQLAREFTKVVLIVAGNKKDELNPFSYDTRVKMMRASMPDVEPKLEVYRATYDGVDSFYLPGIIADIIADHNSSIRPDTATTVLAEPSRFDEIEAQFDKARTEDENELFDPNLYRVQKFEPLGDDEGKQLNVQSKQAVMNDDKEAFRGMVDEHLASNDNAFDHIWQKLKDDITPFDIEEMIGKMVMEFMGAGVMGGTHNTAGLGHIAGRGPSGASAWSNSSMRRYTDPSIYGDDFTAGDVKRGNDDDDDLD